MVSRSRSRIKSKGHFHLHCRLSHLPLTIRAKLPRKFLFFFLPFLKHFFFLETVPYVAACDHPPEMSPSYLAYRKHKFLRINGSNGSSDKNKNTDLKRGPPATSFISGLGRLEPAWTGSGRRSRSSPLPLELIFLFYSSVPPGDTAANSLSPSSARCRIFFFTLVHVYFYFLFIFRGTSFLSECSSSCISHFPRLSPELSRFFSRFFF